MHPESFLGGTLSTWVPLLVDILYTHEQDFLLWAPGSGTACLPTSTPLSPIQNEVLRGYYPSSTLPDPHLEEVGPRL